MNEDRPVDTNREFSISSMFSRHFAEHINNETFLDFPPERFIPGETDNEEIIKFLCYIARNRNVFEFGTCTGRTTANIAKYARFVITLDSNIQEYEQYEIGKFYKEARRPNVIQLIGDSFTYDFTPYYNYADVVYINGDSSFIGCNSDITNAYKIARNNGWIIINNERSKIDASIYYYINLGWKFVKTGQLYITKIKDKA